MVQAAAALRVFPVHAAVIVVMPRLLLHHPLKGPVLPVGKKYVHHLPSWAVLGYCDIYKNAACVLTSDIVGSIGFWSLYPIGYTPLNPS